MLEPVHDMPFRADNISLTVENPAEQPELRYRVDIKIEQKGVSAYSVSDSIFGSYTHMTVVAHPHDSDRYQVLLRKEPTAVASIGDILGDSGDGQLISDALWQANIILLSTKSQRFTRYRKAYLMSDSDLKRIKASGLITPVSNPSRRGGYSAYEAAHHLSGIEELRNMDRLIMVVTARHHPASEFELFQLKSKD